MLFPDDGVGDGDGDTDDVRSGKIGRSCGAGRPTHSLFQLVRFWLPTSTFGLLRAPERTRAGYSNNDQVVRGSSAQHSRGRLESVGVLHCWMQVCRETLIFLTDATLFKSNADLDRRGSRHRRPSVDAARWNSLGTCGLPGPSGPG